jgi:hypothetical protein
MEERLKAIPGDLSALADKVKSTLGRWRRDLWDNIQKQQPDKLATRLFLKSFMVILLLISGVFLMVSLNWTPHSVARLKKVTLKTQKESSNLPDLVFLAHTSSLQKRERVPYVLNVPITFDNESMDSLIIPKAMLHGKKVYEALDIVQLLPNRTMKYVEASELPTQDPVNLTPIKDQRFIWNEQYVFLGPNNIPIPEEWVTFDPLSTGQMDYVEACIASSVLCTAIELRLEKRFINNTKIPAFIHQSWRLHHAENEVVNRSVTSFLDMNPGYVHLYWQDPDIAAFFKFFHPELVTFVDSLSIKVMKFDIFRYLVLYRFGGVWSDTDTLCLKPVDKWVKLPEGVEPGMRYNKTVDGNVVNSTAGLIEFMVALELDYMHMDRQYGWRNPKIMEHSFGYPHPASVVQWTLVAADQQEILKEICIASIRNSIYYESLSEEGKIWLKENRHRDLAVLKLTGPGMFSKIIHEHITEKTGLTWRDLTGLQEEFTAGDDLHIFTVTGFSAGHDMPMGFGPVDDPRALVKHLFSGSWKS